MKCPLDVQRKARGHKKLSSGKRPRQDGGWDSSTQNWGPPQVWNEPEIWETRFKGMPARGQKKKPIKGEEPRADIINAKGEKRASTQSKRAPEQIGQKPAGAGCQSWATYQE